MVSLACSHPPHLQFFPVLQATVANVASDVPGDMDKGPGEENQAGTMTESFLNSTVDLMGKKEFPYSNLVILIT